MAPGSDSISNKLVKQAAAVLLDPLVHIHNLSFCTGIAPDKLKLAKVSAADINSDAKVIVTHR
jgi:hypothetical protein